LTAFVRAVRGLQPGNIGRSIFANEFWHGRLAAQNLPLFHANQVVTRCPSCSPVAFDETEIQNSVNKLPVYPGGSQAFQQFLDDLSKKLTAFLPVDQKKTFITVEYIVNKDGKVILPKVLKGANNEMNNLIIEKFEAMPLWAPAVRLEKNVPIRLKQTIYVEMP